MRHPEALGVFGVDGLAPLQLRKHRIDQRFALKNFNLRLNIDGIDGGVVLVQRIGFLDIQEVIVQADDLDRGPRLINGSLRERHDETQDGADSGDKKESPTAAAQNTPIFDQSASFRFRRCIRRVYVTGIGIGSGQRTLFPVDGG